MITGNRLKIGTTLRNKETIETYVPQVKINGAWVDVLDKGTVIYKETQDGFDGVKHDQKELAKFFLDSFIEKYNERYNFVKKYFGFVKSDSKIIDNHINELMNLEYVQAYSGSIENPKQKTYVVYGDVIELINKTSDEFNVVMRRELTKYEESLVDYVSDLTNRGVGQTKELFELCDYDFNKLCRLESKIKNTFTHFCPGDKKSVDKLLSLEDKTNEYDFKKLTKNRQSKLYTEGQERLELESNVKTLSQEKEELEKERDNLQAKLDKREKSDLEHKLNLLVEERETVENLTELSDKDRKSKLKKLEKSQTKMEERLKVLNKEEVKTFKN